MGLRAFEMAHEQVSRKFYGRYMETALLFSGQGSQYVGMIKDIAEKYPEVKEKTEKADDIAGYKLSNICFNGPGSILKETRNTQPAIFLHSAVIFDLIKNDIDFDALAGHSVGEYSALYAGGVLQFEDAMKLVSLRGKLMFQAGTKQPGTMFAVIGMDDDKVKEVADELSGDNENEIVVAANFNSPGQIVVSGSAEFLRENINVFKENGAKLVKELVVSGAFHSPLMESAKEELENAINDIDFNDAEKPIYTNVYARPMNSAEGLKEALIKQLTSPVLWTQTLSEMNNNGISNFIEIGPGNVLQGLVKRTLKDVEFKGFDKAEDIEALKSA